MNSVGELPTELLSMSQSFRAQASIANAKQILAQYDVKEKMKAQVEPYFIKYKQLKDWKATLDQLEESALNEEPYNLILKSKALIKEALKGLRYYQT